jgi:hypothetical protein
MHNAFRNPLVIEMEDFLSEMEVFKESRTARTDFQRVLVVRNWTTLRRCQNRHFAGGDLMKLTALTTHKCLIVDRCSRFVRSFGRFCHAETPQR